jgi:hypothetical protein
MSDLLVVAMEREGISAEEGRKKIFLVDSKGLVVKVRTRSIASVCSLDVSLGSSIGWFE